MHDDVPDRIGTAMRGYRVARLIGIGGAAAVYEARRLGPRGTGERVACKVMHEQQRDEPRHRELVRQEAVLGLRVTAGHPGLVEILDFFDDAHAQHCIVMELVDGASVAELRGPDRCLPSPIARRIAVEVLEALVYLHGRGVLHRDLSPRNILVTAGGAVKLADLGTARRMEQGQVHTQTLRGTPMYVAREAIELLPLDARADLFSLGTILYELVTGAPPCGEPSRVSKMLVRNAGGEFAPLPPDTPADLAELITGLLQPERDARRPQTAAEALALLHDHGLPMASAEELASLVPSAQARRDRELADERPASVLPPGHVLAPRDVQELAEAPAEPEAGQSAERAPRVMAGRTGDAVPRHISDPLPDVMPERVIDAVVERVVDAAPGCVTQPVPGPQSEGVGRWHVNAMRRIRTTRAALVAVIMACVLVLGLLVHDRLQREQRVFVRQPATEAPVPVAEPAPAQPIVPVPVPVAPEQPRLPDEIADTTESRRAAERTDTLRRGRVEGQRGAQRGSRARVRGRAVPLGGEPPPWARP